MRPFDLYISVYKNENISDKSQTVAKAKEERAWLTGEVYSQGIVQESEILLWEKGLV